MSNILRKSQYWALIIIVLTPLALSSKHSPVGIDSGYYLSVVERINDGYNPYKGLNLVYTPFYFYLLVLLKYIFSIGINYTFFLFVHYIIQICNAYFIYKISTLLLLKREYSFYAASLFLISSHWNEGNMVLLEMPCIFWGLLSITLSLKYNASKYLYFFIGLTTAAAFLTKQYGIGYLFLIIFLTLYNKEWLIQIVFLLFGFSILFLFTFLFFGKDFFNIILSGGYGTASHKSFFYPNLKQLYLGVLFMHKRIFPNLIFGYCIYIITLYKHKIFNRNIIFLTLGLYGFLLQFFFAPFSHYYLFSIPFACIISLYFLNVIPKYQNIYKFALTLTLLLSIYSTYRNRVYKEYINNKDKEIQISLAKKICKMIPQNKSMYIYDVGLIPQYYLTNRTPPNLSTIGYTFGLALSNENHIKQITQAHYIIKFKKDYSNTSHYDIKAIKNVLKLKNSVSLGQGVQLYYTPQTFIHD